MTMMNVIARNWWLLVLRGVAAILFGVLAYVVPGITLASLVLLFGAYAIVDGIFTLASSRSRGQRPLWAIVLHGIAGIGAGLVTFFWPGITAVALLITISTWAIITGVLEVVAAIRLRKEIKNEWLLGISGALSVAFGIAMWVWPAASALAMVWLIGAYAIAFGVLLIAVGVRLKAFATPEESKAAAPHRLIYE
jgi:uncharacterized membrane protein HdeD (DUF308 family)